MLLSIDYTTVTFEHRWDQIYQCPVEKTAAREHCNHLNKVRSRSTNWTLISVISSLSISSIFTNTWTYKSRNLTRIHGIKEFKHYHSIASCIRALNFVKLILCKSPIRRSFVALLLETILFQLRSFLDINVLCHNNLYVLLYVCICLSIFVIMIRQQAVGVCSHKRPVKGPV